MTSPPLGPSSLSSSPPPPITPSNAIPSQTSDGPASKLDDAQSYSTRSNRYLGPSSTYHSWIEEERITALSLDRIRGRDLARHLLAAQRLRKGIKRAGTDVEGEGGSRGRGRKGKGKDRARSSSTGSEVDGEGRVEGEDGERVGRGGRRVNVPKAWTAWPLPPDRVPRQRLLSRTLGDGIYRGRGDGDEGLERPSAELERWLVATATRIARERWEAREWEDEEGDKNREDGRANGYWTVDHGDEGMERDGEDATTGTEDDGTSAATSQDDDDGPEAHEDEEGPTFFSQPIAFNGSSSSSSPTPSLDQQNRTSSRTRSGSISSSVSISSSESEHQPVPLADDEVAHKLFAPSARHILSKLDDLLMALHKMRYAYASKAPGKPRGRYSRSQSRARATPTEAEGGEEDSDDVRPRGRSHSLSSRRRAESVATAVSDTSATSASRSRRVQDLKLRDWSEVVGVAALTGWDENVVRRASGRCARLFGENMLFRTVPGQSVVESGSQVGKSGTYLAVDDEREVDDDGEVEEEQDNATVRVSRPCNACLTSRQECQPAGDEDTGLLQSCKACQDDGAPCSGIRVGRLDNGKYCPAKQCPRHRIPFRKAYGLQRHIDTMHPGHTPSTAKKRARSYSRGRSGSARPYTDVDMTSDSDTSAPPHAQEIVCPVQLCPRSQKPFSKGKKLYEHVRRMHPELDVNEVKKSESLKRAEKRGRWKNVRRKRSRSTNGRSESPRSR